MKNKRRKSVRKGAALLTVLFIVMLVSIYTMGYLVRSDSELACGRNSLLRTQAEYTALAGLEQARWAASYGVTSYTFSQTQVGSCWFEGSLGSQSGSGPYTLEVTISSLHKNGTDTTYFNTYYGTLYCDRTDAANPVIEYISVRKQ